MSSADNVADDSARSVKESKSAVNNVKPFAHLLAGQTPHDGAALGKNGIATLDNSLDIIRVILVLNDGTLKCLVCGHCPRFYKVLLKVIVKCYSYWGI